MTQRGKLPDQQLDAHVRHVDSNTYLEQLRDMPLIKTKHTAHVPTQFVDAKYAIGELICAGVHVNAHVELSNGGNTKALKIEVTKSADTLLPVYDLVTYRDGTRWVVKSDDVDEIILKI